MKRAHSRSTRVATLALLAAAVLVVGPGAQPRGPGGPQPGQAHRVEMVHGRRAIAGDVLVKFRRLPEAQDLARLESDLDAEPHEKVGGAGLRRFHSKRLRAEELLAFLNAHPDVEYAEPNYVVSADSNPNDTSFGSLWGLRNTGQTIGVAGTPGVDIG